MRNEYPKGINWVLFSTRNTNVYKICQIRKAMFSIVYNFLQPNFAILLSLDILSRSDVVIFLPVSIFFKIPSKRLKVHSSTFSNFTIITSILIVKLALLCAALIG